MDVYYLHIQNVGGKHLVLSVNLSVNPLNPIVHHTMHYAMVLCGLIPTLAA